MENCVICNKLTDKYKCPNCFQPYCSLDCCKAHKIQPCAKGWIDKNAHELVIEEDRQPNNTILFPTVDTVPLESLEKLKISEELKSLLCNPHLRNFLVEIDCAPNAWKAMRLAMMEPLFLEFADECLKTIESDSAIKST